MYYNATLCNLASADLHTGINGTVVVVGVKCLFALFFSFGIALCHRRYEDGNVLKVRRQKQRKKYDSCKRRQCHIRQAKRWVCVVAVWLKPYFFCAWAERGFGFLSYCYVTSFHFTFDNTLLYF